METFVWNKPVVDANNNVWYCLQGLNRWELKKKSHTPTTTSSYRKGIEQITLLALLKSNINVMGFKKQKSLVLWDFLRFNNTVATKDFIVFINMKVLLDINVTSTWKNHSVSGVNSKDRGYGEKIHIWKQYHSC